MYDRISKFIYKRPLLFIVPILIVFVMVVKCYIEKNNPTGTSWDYLAFPISCIALFYAICSYSIAKETLVSQKETQKNTFRFSTKSQALVLSKIATQLVDNFCRLSAMNKFLQSVGGRGYPLPRLFNEMYVEHKSIHLELAYDNSEYFLNLSLIQQALARYNKSIISIQQVLEESSFNKKMINNEMSVLIQQTTNIFCQICELFKIEETLIIEEMRHPLLQFIKDKTASSVPLSDNKKSHSIEGLLDLLFGSIDSDNYRSVITNKRLYNSINNDVEKFYKSIRDSLIINTGMKKYKFLLWEKYSEQELNHDNFLQVLGFIAYLYYKNELKDIILIDNGKKDIHKV